jgi:hypothetical protein
MEPYSFLAAQKPASFKQRDAGSIPEYAGQLPRERVETYKRENAEGRKERSMSLREPFQKTGRRQE